MRLWHFTSTLHLPWIIEAGFLKTTDSNLYDDTRPAPGCCWFLDIPDPSGASHGLSGSAVDKKEVRFTVDVPDTWVRPWLPWATAQGIDHDWLTAITTAGGGMDAAEHWYVTFRTVPITRWTSVDLLVNGQWEQFAPDPTPAAQAAMNALAGR